MFLKKFQGSLERKCGKRRHATFRPSLVLLSSSDFVWFASFRNQKKLGNQDIEEAVRRI
ncbi:MAG: hypothetical protein JWM11_4070, partial [Planctomycetaceae bacterium]|nr:hypothetical protein [Planctomycetaceae bacterium]